MVSVSRPSTLSLFWVWGEEEGKRLYANICNEDAPLFMTVSVTNPWTPNYRPGDTDPNIPPILQNILDIWRGQTMLESTREKITVLINQLALQGRKMM